MLRIIRSVAKILAFLCLAFVVWVGFYAYNEGFTKKWRRLIMQEFDRRGIEAEIGKLTIDPLDGLVARNVKIFSDQKKTTLVASINNITLDLDVLKLLRKKQFLNSIEFRDTDIYLPINPEDDNSKKIRVTDLNARVRVPGSTIEIENADCFLNGIKINLVGSLTLKDNINSSILENSFTDKNSKSSTERRALLSSIVTEVEKISFDYKDPPQIKIKFISDLNEVEKTSATVALQASNLSRFGSNYQINFLGLETEYERGDFSLKKIKVNDRFGELTGTAQWINQNSSLPFQLESSIDIAEFAKSFINNKNLNDLLLIDPPQVSASGVIKLGNDLKKTNNSIKVFGSVKFNRLIFRDTLFERGVTSFSFNDSNFYLRNLLFEHESGTISGNYLKNESNNFQFDSEIKMDPKVFIPLMNKAPDFLTKLDLPKNPAVDVKIRGNGKIGDLKALQSEGTFTVGSCKYNGTPITAATGKVELLDETLKFSSFRIDRKEGHLNGAEAIIQLKDGLVKLNQVNGTVFPEKIASYFSSDIEKTLSKYPFKDPPYISLNGIIDTKKNQQTDLNFTFISKSEVKADILKTKVTLKKPKGTININGKNLNLSINAEFANGNIKHIGSTTLGSQSKYYNGRIQGENIHFGKLIDTFKLNSKTNGIIGSDIGFKIPINNPEKWSGEGTISLTQGNIISIPILGPISPIISSVLHEPKAGYSVAQSAKATFKTEGGMMNIIDFQALTPSFLLRSNGFINLVDKKINLEAEMNARGHLSLVGWPLSRLLRYKGTGTLSKPKWEPVNFTLPREIIANGERVLKDSNATEIIPEAIGIIPNTIQSSIKALEELTSPKKSKRNIQEKKNNQKAID